MLTKKILNHVRSSVQTRFVVSKLTITPPLSFHYDRMYDERKIQTTAEKTIRLSDLVFLPHFFGGHGKMLFKFFPEIGG